MSRYDIITPKLLTHHKLMDGYMLVDIQSYQSQRKAVEAFARYFRREMHYDFLQYNYKAPAGEAYLFFMNVEPVGAVHFLQNESGWYLNWAWIHPYARGEGLIQKAWPSFVQRYGTFAISLPISPAMKRLLAKVNHPYIDDTDQGK
ncbi:hypothetical protein GGR92_004813 [Spirosoma lacussanchae]|uniref:hypothetical protein n=1 Tax=Spirosoma lacussanchae TaxID=1884249 RepID=UPI0011095E52|nr:hypothetical protein [Spirosoma lacussanchae]